MDSFELARLAYDRSQIAEALYRYAFGLDHGDADTLASVLTEDCVLDFSAAAAKIGIQFPVLNGRAHILNVIIPMIGPLDTSHSASNIQIDLAGDTAALHAYIMSQHFMPGQGSRRGSEFALLMNRYDAELVREGDSWRFRHMKIDNAWAEGDPQILTALATHRVTRVRPK